MAEKTFLQQYRSKLAVALLLTLASGLVDIVGYVGIFHFFTAHLTGTTVQLGRSLVTHQWIDVEAAAVIVGAFLCGSILARAIIEVSSRRRIHRIASVTLTIEGFMLAALAFGSSELTGKPHWSLAVLAAAMGIQTATLTGVGPLTVHTSFVTGMLNKFAQLASHVAFRGYDLLTSKGGNSEARRAQNEEVRMAAFLFFVWVFYVGGAAIGTWSFRSWGLQTLFIAVGLLGIALLTDQFLPLSIEEENEQSER